MVADETLARLCRHAGLEGSEVGGIPSVAESAWPLGEASASLERAFDDFIAALNVLNGEMNHDAPMQALPRRLVYAVTEVLRLLREGQEKALGENDRRWFALAAWRADTAWTAVLSGDIEDIHAHVKSEEAMRRC